MTKKVLRRLAAVLLAVLVVAGTMLTAFAETSQYVPYENYTYWEDITGAGRKLVYNRPMYDVQGVLTNKDIGVEAFTELADVCTDKHENVYLLDKGSPDAPAKIIVLDASYKYKKEIAVVKKASGEELEFVGANNVYVHTDGSIFISDTENARVIKCDNDGNYIDEYTLPDSPLIPEEFDYRPVKVVADSRGYVYILSEGSYYGALLFAPAESGTSKEFIGFYGANTVVNGILGAIQSAINRMFPNNEKMANQTRSLPYTFSDIVIDDKDFIYTTTDSAANGQLRKLNPGGGSNILKSDAIRFIDDAVNRTYLGGHGFALYQRIIGIDVDEKGFMYALDATYGRIYVYDAQCRLLSAFGGGMQSGSQKGSFRTATALTIKESKDSDGNVLVSELLVADKTNNNLTIFRRNDYGNMIINLTRMTIDGDYVESREGWEEAIKLDKNLQIAYTGLARAYLAEKNYDKAMEVALEGYDRETYALAFEYQRQELISKNFALIFGVVILIVAAVIVLIIIKNKKKKKDEDEVPKKSETKLAFSTLIHPGLAFEEMKDKNRGSVKVSIVILLLFYVTAVLKVLWGGFLFTQYDPGTFNSLWVFVQSAGLVALWVIANWLVTTLMGGKGKMKEIFIVTCYSLMPMIGERIIYIILTNFLLPTEGSFLGILTTIAMIYSGLLLIIGMMRIHDFSFGRLIGTTLLTVFGMAAIIFLMILVGILLQQLGGFLATIVTELFM